MSRTLIFAHRGANKEAAENTRSAFDRALAYAIDGIETDVQLSRDEVTVLWHDRFLGKLGHPLRHIDDFDHAQLQAMNFAAHFSSAAKPEGIMSLQEFLDAYRKRCRLLLEIKSRDWEPVARHQIKVRQMLEMVGAPDGDAIMASSFNLASLIYAHQCAPEFPLVYNFETDQTFADAQRVLSEQSFLNGLCLPIETLDEPIARLLRDRGKSISVYTCNSDAEIGKALKLGVDILISDVPQKALQMRDEFVPSPCKGEGILGRMDYLGRYVMKREFASLAGKQFDLLVCGGGIYGAWTAYDAALRGLSVAIVEQGDWAGATSSASSKLIHGGLRYLETYDFKLVRKAIQERQRLLELAPHRVWPLRFGVPIYADSRIGTLQLKAGLTLYDLLAGFPGPAIAHRHFNRAAFAEHFPALASDGLKGGFSYGDAQTDDARLVLELIAGAMDVGAVCVNHCRMTGLSGLAGAGGQATGATIQNALNGNSAQVLARQIVQTSGQWTASSAPGRDWCRLSKGVHLVMPALPGDEALLLTAKSDGRVFFMIPWYGMTLVGTTDDDYSGEPDRVSVEAKDIAYLLAAANRYLKTAWSAADIVGSYAGVRVMKRSDKASPSDVSRDWELKTAGNGVHYSIGGKLTSAREDAADIVDAVCAQLGISTRCATEARRFPWAPEEDFANWSVDLMSQARQLGVDQDSAKWLLRRHGKRTDEVLRSIAADPRLGGRIVPGLPFIHADLLFCARNEMVVHLEDLLRRRMPLLILAKLSEATLRRIAGTVADAMGWDEAAIDSEIETCMRITN